MNKKIIYVLTVYYKYSMLDMSFDFRIKGNITYRNKKYAIDAMKTHDGPEFHYTYFERPSEIMIEILRSISSKLLSVIDEDLYRNGPVQNKEYTGEIEIE